MTALRRAIISFALYELGQPGQLAVRIQGQLYRDHAEAKRWQFHYCDTGTRCGIHVAEKHPPAVDNSHLHPPLRCLIGCNPYEQRK